MSLDYTAYAAYGIRIALDSVNGAGAAVDGLSQLIDVKSQCPDVGHLTLSWDTPAFYLVTGCESADRGEAAPFEPGSAQEREWTRQLAIAVRALGWGDKVDGMPHWFVALHVS